MLMLEAVDYGFGAGERSMIKINKVDESTISDYEYCLRPVCSLHHIQYVSTIFIPRSLFSMLLCMLCPNSLQIFIFFGLTALLRIHYPRKGREVVGSQMLDEREN